MTKYRIKEHKGEFIIESLQEEETKLVKVKKWIECDKSVVGLTVRYETLQDAINSIEEIIMMEAEPKYHYYPDDTIK